MFGAAHSIHAHNQIPSMISRSALILAFALFPFTVLADITGPARVIDGDTIDINGQRIRLHGIDAPELRVHYTRMKFLGPSGRWSGPP